MFVSAEGPGGKGMIYVSGKYQKTDSDRVCDAWGTDARALGNSKDLNASSQL